MNIASCWGASTKLLSLLISNTPELEGGWICSAREAGEASWLDGEQLSADGNVPRAPANAGCPGKPGTGQDKDMGMYLPA